MSELYAPALKETPAEAEIASHRLLLRAGYIRKTAAGIYSILPLGWRVVQKIEQIIREEMDAVDAQEMRLPILQPKELWVESGRWDAYGPELMRLTDRHERAFCLGPTHEEIITALVASDVRSYRDLPFCLYQMNTKFRDEMRPRFGLLRAREFLMKDAYSFHANPADLSAYYERQAQAYGRICDRCGLTWRRVDADSGEIGGKVTAEFMALADAGEAEIVFCDCGYAADAEVFDGDLCPDCGRSTQRAHGIEVSQVFEIGTKYSDAMGVRYLDETGVEQPLWMGCYGIGITRMVAAVVEQRHDDDGIIWPTAIAPYGVAVLPLGDGEVAASAARIAADLSNAGHEVILDDRFDVRPGVKFAEADLYGWPLQVIVGKRGLAAGTVEVKTRATGVRAEYALSELIGHFPSSTANGV
jgi:prolyl-tRNA synthetase